MDAVNFYWFPNKQINIFKLFSQRNENVDTGKCDNFFKKILQVRNLCVSVLLMYANYFI